MHYIYIVRCSDNTYYTGYTTNVDNRIKTHNSGKGAKYTRGRLPVYLMYKEEFSEKGDALRREMQIKKMSRQNKENLFISSKL